MAGHGHEEEIDVFSPVWTTGGIKGDSFHFIDTAKGFPGGVYVQGGDVNDAPHHTPEWSNPKGGDPGTPAPTGTVTFFINGNAAQLDDYAGSHALYQDVFIP